MPGAGCSNGCACPIVFGEQRCAFVLAFGAGWEGGAVLASEHQGVRGLELVWLDVSSAGDAMNVLEIRRGLGARGCESFFLAFGESLFSLHGSIRRRARARATLWGSYEVRGARASGETGVIRHRPLGLTAAGAEAEAGAGAEAEAEAGAGAGAGAEAEAASPNLSHRRDASEKVTRSLPVNRNASTKVTKPIPISRRGGCHFAKLGSRRPGTSLALCHACLRPAGRSFDAWNRY